MTISIKNNQFLKKQINNHCKYGIENNMNSTRLRVTHY